MFVDYAGSVMGMVMGETDQEQKDVQRNIYLKNERLYILRFNNLQILQKLDSVIDVIYRAVKERM